VVTALADAVVQVGAPLAWNRKCAFCRFYGQLGAATVGFEAAHVRWFNPAGPTTRTTASHYVYSTQALRQKELKRLREHGVSLDVRETTSHPSFTQFGSIVVGLHLVAIVDVFERGKGVLDAEDLR
jgi:hypothetical protein